jgi:adenylosuccinate lyase
MVVYPQVIARNLREELPFMATENILMAAVAAGGDRQDLHERIRQHSQAAAAEVKQHGRPNDLMARLAADPAFAAADLEAAIEPASLVGRAPEQVDEFLAEVVEPIRKHYASKTAADTEAPRV